MPSAQLSQTTAEDRHTTGAGRHQGLPFTAILGFASGLAIIAVSASQLQDIDLYWHILAGSQIVSGTPIDGLGTAWSYAPDPNPWTSTQWLSEVILHYLHAWGSWSAVAAFRVVTASVTVAVVAGTTLRGRPAALAGLPYLVALTAIAYASQERPQQATFIGAAVLGGVLSSGLRGQTPRWYLVVLGTVVWANLHGGWVLVPLVLCVLAVGRAADHGVRDRGGWQLAGLAALTVACGLATPAGFAGVTAAFRFRKAAGAIQEWQLTQPLHIYGLLTALMLLFVCLGWARSQRVPVSEIIAFFVCLVFSWTAWRNVAPGILLAAPLVAHRLTAAFPQVRKAEPRWSVPVGVGAAVLLAVGSLGMLLDREHLPEADWPVSLAQQIATLPAGQRVLNDYNAAGLVLFFGGPRTQVGIDGRTDRYGAQYIEDYIGMRTLKSGWEALLDELDPTSALFEEDMAIAHVLQAERGWRVIGQESGWVLLVPPE